MEKKSKKAGVTNENLRPLNHKPANDIGKQKLFNVFQLNSIPQVGTPNSSQPLQETKPNAQADIKPSSPQQGKKPEANEEEHILDFDRLLELLQHLPPQKTNLVLIDEREKKEAKRKKATTVKLIRKERHKKKGKRQMNDIYSINNFFSSTTKIVEKKEFINIECPSFKEIDSPYDDSRMEVDDLDEEDISEVLYKKLHEQLELKEREARLHLYDEGSLKGKKRDCSLSQQIEANPPLIISIPVDLTAYQQYN